MDAAGRIDCSTEYAVTLQKHGNGPGTCNNQYRYSVKMNRAESKQYAGGDVMLMREADFGYRCQATERGVVDD